MIKIEDPGDPRLEPYRDVRERDLVGRRGLLIAEGEVVLGRLLQSAAFETASVLLSGSRAERIAEQVRGRRPHTPIYFASQTVLDAVAGFHLHRGVLAVGRPKRRASATEVLLDGPPLVMALCGVSNHDNIGGLFRNAAAFGVGAVVLDHRCSDPLYRKAIRVSVGATLTVPYAVLSPTEDIVAVLRAADYRTIALSPKGRSELVKLRSCPRTAVLFGPEGPGLPSEVLERLATVRIPMAQGWDSLNVATSAGIVLHHLSALRPSHGNKPRGGDRLD